MKAFYQCPMCSSLREEIDPEGETIHLRLDHRCKLCGARLYNYFVLLAYKGSWVRLMEDLFPAELKSMIDQLRQVKDVNNL